MLCCAMLCCVLCAVCCAVLYCPSKFFFDGFCSALHCTFQSINSLIDSLFTLLFSSYLILFSSFFIFLFSSSIFLCTIYSPLSFVFTNFPFSHTFHDLDALDLGLVSQESFGLTVANCLPNTKNKSKYVPGKPTAKITETQLLPWKDGLNALYKFLSGNTFPAICHREVFIQVRYCYVAVTTTIYASFLHFLERYKMTEVDSFSVCCANSLFWIERENIILGLVMTITVLNDSMSD